MRYDENQVNEIAARVVKVFDKRGYKFSKKGNYSYSGVTLYFAKGPVENLAVDVTTEGRYRFSKTRRSSDGTNNLYIVLERVERYVQSKTREIENNKKEKEQSEKIKAEMVKVFGEVSKENESDYYGEYENKYGPVTIGGKVKDSGEVIFTVSVNTKYDGFVATPEQIKQVIAIFNQPAVA